MVHNIEPHWVLVSRKLAEHTDKIIDAVKFNQLTKQGLREIKRDYFIYKSQAETEFRHTRRYINHSLCLPFDFRRLMQDKLYDLVFLVEAEGRKEFIVKASQSDKNKEIWDEIAVSQRMSEKCLGPRLCEGSFPVTFGPHTIYFFIEECLSPRAGWHPLVEVWKGVKRHPKKFICNFAKIVAALHRSGILYVDDFFVHLFIKPLTHELKLIDFGIACKNINDCTRFDKEVEACLNFLKRNYFSPELQEKFLDIYEKDFRFVGARLRTDTVIQKGITYSLNWRKS